MEKFSISDFKSFMPIPLSCPVTKPISRFLVFCNSGQQPSEPASITKQKIKAALELFDFARFPTLVQFWARTIAQDQQVFLHTSDLPFGLSVLQKGLCSFRKHCLNRTYAEADGCGPPPRVFRRKFPEFCPDMGSYSAEEFELKDFAVANGIRGYLSLPVYEPDWQCCIGVLEILTVMDGSYYFCDVIHRVSHSLKEVGLMSSDVFWPFDMKRLPYNQIGNGPPEYERALDEIQKVLDVLCKKYKLPFAQTWVVTSDENGEEIMSTTKEGSHISTKKVSSFKKDCSWFHLRKGQGIVWNAFSSGTSCFCRDITRLNITEYALVLSARKAHLSGGFAICLQSSYTGTAVYVIELFLPEDQNIHKQPSSFMSSMLVTMKQQFRTLKLGSGRKIGTDLPVAVLKISKDDPLDSFVISQTMNFGEGLRNQGNKAQPRQENTASSSSVFECSQDGGVVQSHDRMNELHPQQTISVSMRTLSLGEAVSSDVLEKRHGKRPTNFPDNPTAKKSKRNTVECPSVPHKSEKEAVRHLKESMQNEESIMTVKVEYESDIIKFKVPLSSGMKKLKDEVMKRIKLTAGTFEIKYHCEDNIWIGLDSDAKLQEHMSAIRSSGISTIKLFITTIVPTDNEVKITVKASFKDDLIKFQLSLSAGMSELKNEIINRLKLEDGSFEIKYGDENNCGILLDSDATLQNCISKVISLQKTTLKLSVEPMRTQTTMFVKASYRDDIIKFQLSPSSGMKKLEDEVRKRLKLEAGSFVIKCVDGDDNEISLDGEAALASQMSRMTSMGIHKLNISLQPTKALDLTS